MRQGEPESRAEPRDWLRTVRQSLPMAVRIARSMRPTWDLRGLAALDAGFLRSERIGGLLWDVDGTLTHYHGRALAPEVRTAVEPLFAHPGLRHAIVSNCDDVRLRELTMMFPHVPVLKVYHRDGTPIGRQLLRGVDEWYELSADGATPVQRPAPKLVPLRKPAAAIIRFAVQRLGLEPGEVVMVGDQYWTDVAGANLGGIRSIRIPTVGRSTFPALLRSLQRVDGWMRRVLA